ncbi:hypothetical protein BH23GEM6_BH23GEM6_17650 [soil metagenome]
MSDFQSEPGSETSDLPETSVYSPDIDDASPIETVAAGSAVLLLVGSVDREWAAQTAVELCAEWAARGRRVVLVDMHLESPVLHELLRVPNMEGVVDIFLYGASISRSARPVEGRGFHLITAGTYELDTSAIYRHPRWEKLIAGFRDAEATLVLFAPALSADIDAISPWLSQVILLGPPRSGSLPAVLKSGGVEVSRMLVPPGYRPPMPAEPRRATEPRRSSAPLVIDARPKEAELEPVLRPPGEQSETRTRHGATVAITLLLLALLLGAAGYGMAVYRPDLVPWLVPPGAVSGDGSAAGSTAAATTVRRVGETVPFAVLVKSYASLSAAQQQVQVEQRRFSDTPFYISPEDDSGVLYYKVYAGLLRDTASAERLRERLLQGGAVDTDDTLGALSLIHRAHLSFDLGEFSSREAALQAGDSLLAQDIPAYSVAMPYEDGSRRWQLYGGAFRDSVTADAMRRRLITAGIDTRLVLRVGEPAPGVE